MWQTKLSWLSRQDERILAQYCQSTSNGVVLLLHNNRQCEMRPANIRKKQLCCENVCGHYRGKLEYCCDYDYIINNM